MQMHLTLQGMYDYDNTLFDLWELPEDVDKTQLVDAILFRAGEFELLYPQLTYMKYQIGAWGARHNRTFEKWLEALAIEYNPLENYDRIEDYRDEHRGTNSNTSNTYGTNTESDHSTQAQNTTGDVEGKVSAYDSATYSPKEKNVSSGTLQDVTDRQASLADSHTTNGSGTDNWTDIHSSRIHGNIGVTTSSALLKESLEVQKFSFYDAVADLFVQDFCIMIY